MRKSIIALVFFAFLAGMPVIGAAGAAEPVYSFTGRGTAHGVGLDMSGVKALADRGKGYEEILKTYYTGVSLVGGRENEWLRVGILSSGELRITADGTYRVFVNNAPHNQPTATVGAGVVTRVKHENGQYVTSVDGGQSWTAAAHTWFSSAQSGKYLKVENNGRRYRDLIEGRYSTTGQLWAINVINLENYVKGLAEEPNDWPTEGQRTLAVAARTYALNKKLYSTRWDSENFDIDATLGSQYYLGFDAERSNLVAAVGHTRGRVIEYGGRVIVAAYHGNSGGHTESLENVWGGSSSDYPYLRAVPSPWTPVYNWGPVNFTKTQLQNIFNSRSEGYIGTLNAIDLSNRTASGRVRKVKLIGSAGTKEVWGYSQFASWLGLPSGLFDLNAPLDYWDEWLLVQNPTNRAGRMKLTFMFPNGRRKVVDRSIRPNTRQSIGVDGLVPPGANSVKISSTVPIVADRSLYFNYNGNDGGHTSLGLKAPSKRWYLADGRTDGGFETWVSVLNPRGVGARVKAVFMPGRGRRVAKSIYVKPYSRAQINVDSISGLSAAPTPARITANEPVIVERTTYFNANGRVGGDTSRGSPKLSRTWYFAEGCSYAGFDTRLLLFNPSGTATKATVRLSKSNGDQVVRRYTLPAYYRKSIFLNRLAPGTEFGIKVTADTGIAAERTVYFNYGGRTGAHSSVGAVNQARTSYFAEGNTGTNFDQFLALYNSNRVSGSVTIDYLAEGGGVLAKRVHALPPRSRKTVAVGAAGEIGGGKAAGMRIRGNIPFTAERVMYFDYPGQGGQASWSGGHVGLGAVSPANTWYFAEGVTQ